MRLISGSRAGICLHRQSLWMTGDVFRLRFDGFRARRWFDLLALISLSVLSFLTLGYHPGFEDDGVYLAAVERRVNPALFPHDFRFFTVQLQATIFDSFLGLWVRWTGMPVAWSELLWQSLAIVGILGAGLAIARALFADRSAQWAGVALLGAMFALPVSGTALYVVDQHLHPRTLATALILGAVALVLRGRWRVAAGCLALAFLFHPIMGALGVSFCVFQGLAGRGKLDWLNELRWPGARPALILMPLGWMFEPPSAAWREALSSRTYYFLFAWHWYEWLGALAPMALFWLLGRWAWRRGEVALARFAAGVFAYAVFQQAVAVAMTGPPELIRLIPLQPMRYLHLVYIAMLLAGGALLGRFALKRRVWRWVVYLAVLNGGMYASQRAIFTGTAHLELPGLRSGNPWVQAFLWIRGNTPEDAYFALDPRYLEAEGEDFHGFRALSERSALADGVKDTAVCTQVPELADVWLRQTRAQAGFEHFGFEDFERLKREFGVDWVLVRYPAAPSLDCRWHNGLLTVCRIP